MSIFHPYNVRCACGESFTAQLAEAVNAGRMPYLRQSILDGTFHRVSCPACNETMTIEKGFSYTDFRTSTFINVKPRQDRHLWKKASEELELNLKDIPSDLSKRKKRNMRGVFGLGELQEKLIAEDAGIDDRIIEVLKVFIVYEHPFLLQNPRLRLQLNKVTSEDIEFIACFDHNPEIYRVRIPQAVSSNIIENPREIKKWIKKHHRQSNIFEMKNDHWVNMARWSPQNWGLQYLREIAEKVENGETIITDSPKFKSMLEQIPHGNHLSGWAKKDLRTLFLYAKAKNNAKLQDTLFEIRFGIELEDDWGKNNDPDDIDTMWSLLKDLPDSNVEGNTFINQIILNENRPNSWYDPNEGSRGIYMSAGALVTPERFEDTVRHEVGHAVHELYKDKINEWLASQFGWKVFDARNSEIDKWIKLMGGWGNISPPQRMEIRNYLVQALGQQASWSPGSAPNAPAGHPWLRDDFGPRLAFEKTGSNWYRNNTNWYRYNGKAFFLNFYYRNFMVINEDTLDLINYKMPSTYAAMSPLEFFAELYSLYYDLDDPMRPFIPDEVTKWLDTNIGQQEPGAPALASLRPRHRSPAKRARRQTKAT